MNWICLIPIRRAFTLPTSIPRKRYVIEDNLNEIVWFVIRQLLDMTDAFKQKLNKQNNVSRQDSLILAEKLAG